MLKGSCNCGAVRFTVDAALTAANACHCTQCRKQSGHFEASADVPRTALTVQGGDRVSWYHTSPKVRRGFCTTCGSNLFWDPVFQDWTAVALGAFDTPTGAKLAQHIFTAEKGDYYDIADGLPQNAH